MRSVTVRLIASQALSTLGYRIALVALPLLAIRATGSAWTVGLTTGSAGVPVVLAPWWTRSLQGRIGSTRALAALLVGEAAASLAVPITAALHVLSPAVMVLVGLAVGTSTALSGPLGSTLLAQVGDEHESSHRSHPTDAQAQPSGRSAARLLAAQDGVTKAGVTLAPLIGVGLVAWLGLVGAVAADGALTLCGAAVLLGAPTRLSTPVGPGDRVEPVRRLLRRRPTVAAGLAIRGIGCSAWFAFTICLALVGEQHGMGVTLAAVGLTAYSVGAVAGAGIGVWAAGWQRPALVNAVSWLLAGVGWIAMGADPDLLVTGVVAAAMGLVVPPGNAATTALITRTFRGVQRRTMLTAQTTVVTGSTTLGTLVAGPLIAALGAQSAIGAAGAFVAAAATLTALREVVGRSAATRKRLGPAS